MDWIRARSDEQIKQRLNEIVDATARLYEENRFEDITFAMIAKEANFTRSNLYRYFQTKEDIFLELMKHDIEAWRKDSLEKFADGNPSFHDVAEISVELILKHKRMIKLLTILFTLLEPNASLEVLTAFKKKITEEIGVVAQFLSTKLPFPSVEAAAEFLSAQSYLAIGAFPMMNLTHKQKEAMLAAGEEIDPEYYRERLIHAIELLLKGFTAGSL
ncbi:MAG TPA: TetR family transcriptional regulator [Anaerolineales bacterium]|nr:TetR family transcriptional regulator [Anaerolineales bacterium]HSM72848.1 TetR family transcriptional regulator [Anaerolineales bacterium]